MLPGPTVQHQFVGKQGCRLRDGCDRHPREAPMPAGARAGALARRLVGPVQLAGLLVLGACTFRVPSAAAAAARRKRRATARRPWGAGHGCVLYRADRVRRPRTHLPVRAIRPHDGWCDAPADRNYNRPVRHPYPASAERLWRPDALYDVVVVLGYNDRPACAGAAAPSSCTWQGPDMRRPRAASRWRARISCGCSRRLRAAAREVRDAGARGKSARSFRSGR